MVFGSWVGYKAYLAGLGNFDLIVCTGYQIYTSFTSLHHLKKPQKGLNMLNGIQCKHDGANLMVSYMNIIYDS